MPVIDLTHRIEPDMPVFPGTPQPRLERPFTVGEHGFAETRLDMLSHTGTHMDAPAHMIQGATTIDRFDAGRFIGKALCLDVSGHAVIGLPLLEPHHDALLTARFLLLATRWDQHWGTPTYFHSFPVLTEEAARWLLPFNLSGLGTDCISFDRHDSVSYPVHHILLGNNLLLIENLRAISPLAGTSFTFVAAPLHFADADGAPIRALAITHE